MRNYPTEDYETEEAQRLGAKPWQLELLALNPEYNSWGPGEDAMATGDRKGWDSSQTYASWKEFGPWELNDLNEVVNFHFQIGRESKDCPTCHGNSYHPDAQWITESFYSHSSPFKHQTFREQQAAAIMESFGSVRKSAIEYGFPSEEVLAKYGPEFRAFCERMRTKKHWSDDITQDEVEVLVKENRLHDFTSTYEQGKGWVKTGKIPSAQEVNDWEGGRGTGRRGMGHDAINRCILIRARCERLGVLVECPECEGHGHVFTTPEPYVGLVLWYIHPRKGAARGVEVKNIQKEELPAVFQFLCKARDRNAERFGKIPG